MWYRRFVYSYNRHIAPDRISPFLQSNKTSTQSAASTIASRTGPIRGGKNTLARFANRFSALQKKSIGDA